MPTKVRFAGVNHTQLPQIVSDGIALKGLPQTAGYPPNYGDLASAITSAVNNVSFLPTNPVEGQIYNVVGFYEDTEVGGGGFIYDPLLAKSNHNGGTIIAPEAIAAWDGTSANVSQILNWTGTGSGCYVRLVAPDYIAHVDDFGAIGDYNMTTKAGYNNYTVFNHVISKFSTFSFAGTKKYAIDEQLAPGKAVFCYGGESTLCQRVLSKSIFLLLGCSGSVFHYGDYTHNAVLADYNDATNVPAFFNTGGAVNDVTWYNCRIHNTARQGIRNDGGGSRWSAYMCRFEETLRDGFFVLNCPQSSVSNCQFINTGDDSIAFAQNSDGSIATGNTILGAGSYNLGGSGIRFNCTGVASANTIRNSDLFGIIAAVNTVDPANPKCVELVGNVIKGIVKTATVTAGIGIQESRNVNCLNNDIEMNAKEAHAYRLFGATSSGTVSIFGGSVINALSVFYVRQAGCRQLTISNVYAKDCTDFLLLDATGTINSLELKGNTSESTTSACYFRVTGANTMTVGTLYTENNRIATPLAIAFIFGTTTIANARSVNDQFPTGLFADSSGGSNVATWVVDGRYGERLNASGTITFNATNTGLIPIGSFSRAPLASEIMAVQRTTLGSANNWHIDFVDSQNFRIRLNVAPAADVTFDWQVRSFNNRRVI